MRQLLSPWLLIVMLTICSVIVPTTHQTSDQQQQQHLTNSHSSSSTSRDRVRPTFTKPNKQPRPPRVRRSEKPNIVFIITDDQDSELGSLNFMPKTMKYLRDGGATFPNAFVTTPMCCPSRSSMLTGMYVHNHNTYTNNDNCSSPQWRQTYETKNFGTYLDNAGFRTGYFGKYLNDYTGAYIPPGWTEWMGLIRNTRFYNYSINHNMTKIKHEDDYSKDYLTDLIANRSTEFFRESKQWYPQKPVAMVLSMPAPHGPEDAAPQYQNKFFDVKTHRTPSWNFAPNPDKQWLLQYTQKMLPVQVAFTDLLHVKRLQTLQSVDDAVEKVCEMLDEIGELDNTYIIYTSDHGYHLGQYGLVKGKAMPYEFDIKVPFFMRGPKIPENIRVPNIVLNLDLAPTMLDIAGVPVPEHMDGNSILKLFEGSDEPRSDEIRKKRVWRDTFLVERGKLTMRKLKVQEKLEAQYNRLVQTKEQRLEDECRKPEFQPPCDENQEWECRHNEHGKLRIYKCRHNDMSADQSSRQQAHCQCPSLKKHKVHGLEKKRQLVFLKKNVNQPKMIQPRFIKQRTRRGKRHLRHALGRDDDDEQVDDEVEADTSMDLAVSHDWTPIGLGADDVKVPCRVALNDTIVCERYVYTNVNQWEFQKNKVDRIIKAYKDRLSQLKDMRKHLLDSRPTDAPSLELDQRETLIEEDPSGDHKFNGVTDGKLPAGNVLTEVELTVDENQDEDFGPVEEEDEEHPEEEGETGGASEEADNSDGDDETEECICDENGNRKIKNHKLETLARRIEKQEERGNQRKLRMEKHRTNKFESAGYLRKKHKRNRTTGPIGEPVNDKSNCNLQDGRCSSDSSSFDMSTTSPETASSKQVNWDSIDLSLYSSRHDPNCHIEGLECSRMDNEHWKVAPHWTKGPFCFCPNSNNNTYWCLRTVNETHNFLYCEFITGFISFYDMTKDPYQLRNAVHDLSYELLHKLHNSLEKMKGCKGSRKCNLRSKAHEDERSDWKQVRHNSKHDKLYHQYSVHSPSRSLRTPFKQG